MRNILCRCLLILVLASFLPSSLYADGSKLVQGDVINVVVDGEKEFTKPYQIDDQGCITMDMVKPVSVLGLSTSQACAGIAKALGEVLVNPQVTVTFVERARMQVFIVGQVRTPGPSQVGVGDRVIQVLAQAGYDESADLSRVSIRRGDQVINVDLTKYLRGEDLTPNVEVKSGDTIVVPISTNVGTITVTGQVAKTGSIPLKRDMTFREAMGLVGGVTVEADTERITVKHEQASEAVHVDYKHAMDGDPSADLALRPNDTIYVPELETSYFTVLGGVQKPGQYPLKGKMSLSEAIGLAGGAIPQGGDLASVSVTRSTEKGKPGQTIKVNLKDVIAKAEEQPIVQRGDVVYVKEKKPPTPWMQVLGALTPLGYWLFPR